MFKYMTLKNVSFVLLVILLIAGGVYAYQQMTTETTTTTVPTTTTSEEDMEEAYENFTDKNAVHEGFETASAEAQQTSDPASVEQVQQTNQNQLPSECYPKDVLTSADLLPADANSRHAQVVPSGQGALSDQNFLTAGYHIGINTVGQTLRNANRQLRSEPPNPQVPVGPFLNSTIEPDINRRPLEIGGQ
jgi:hypothetical protein